MINTTNILRRWSKQAYNNSKMADGRHFQKIEKLLNSSNGWTDHHEIRWRMLPQYTLGLVCRPIHYIEETAKIVKHKTGSSFYSL